jgi:hypothetical protein
MAEEYASAILFSAFTLLISSIFTVSHGDFGTHLKLLLAESLQLFTVGLLNRFLIANLAKALESQLAEAYITSESQIVHGW